MLTGNGAFAMYNNDATAYRMAFIVAAVGGAAAPIPVPEPGPLALLGAGVAALVAARRRTRGCAYSSLARVQAARRQGPGQSSFTGRGPSIGISIRSSPKNTLPL